MRWLAVLFLGGFACATAQQIELESVANVAGPAVALRASPDGRIFVVRQTGQIDELLAEGAFQVFLDLGPGGLGLTNASGERGLLGMTFHPDYPSDPRFFVNYTDNQSPFGTVIASYAVDSGGAVEDGSGQTILRIEQDFSNHNGGDVHFGPDGYLYVGMGDGGSGNDPCNRAQDGDPSRNPTPDSAGNTSPCQLPGPTRNLLGQMLRIDVDNPGANVARACGEARAYGIPADNPYVEGPLCSEIWASGLRNPYRFSFDRVTGNLVIADVGQNAVEEVNLVDFREAGLNYGWDCREGNIAGARSSPDCNTAGPFVEPAMAYPQSGGRCSVIGGFVYQGGIAAWRGTYFYGDFCTGEIFADRLGGGTLTQPTVVLTPASTNSSYCSAGDRCLLGFGEDHVGDVYALDIGGQVFRIVDPEVSFASGFE